MRFFGRIAFILALVTGTSAMAGGDDLRSLQTGDDGRGWEGVGRLNLGNRGFCTAALIAPDKVLTAAHCLFDSSTGEPHALDDLEFLAGFRNGRAEAYRRIKQGVVHPRYLYNDSDRVNRVAYDLALLELDQPIRRPDIQPFPLAARPRKGDEVGVVSYAEGRSEAPSLQEVCHVLAGRAGMLMLSCNVNFGASGSPVFVFRDGMAQISSVVSSKADVEGRPVALSTALGDTLDTLQNRLAAGDGLFTRYSPVIRRFSAEPRKEDLNAKFLRP